MKKMKKNRAGVATTAVRPCCQARNGWPGWLAEPGSVAITSVSNYVC